jgi:glutamate/tyrosine decarboxylase-like PLP-dependent enzyme
MLEKNTLSLLHDALETMERGYDRLPAHSPRRVDDRAVARVLNDVALRLRDDYPFFHPLYAGHMQQPPHPIARLAYALALWTNPNNHSAAGSRVGVDMEREAVAGIARMIGWRRFAGHLCSGGTLANTEALWVAAQRRPQATIVASEQSHYAHERMSGVLGLSYESIPSDASARIDTRALVARLAQGDVGTVVATLGTTATGAVDALPQLLSLRDRHGFRLHVDAAYGGYFALVDDLATDTRAAFDAIPAVDSIVIDPHKRGLQPYGCSAVLFRDPADASFFRHPSACADFDEGNVTAESGFECSRPGAAAIALWATMQLLPLVKDGEFAATLRASRAAALALYQRLERDERFAVAPSPDLDIVAWAVIGPRAGETNEYARRVLAECARQDVHLSLARLPRRCLVVRGASIPADDEVVTCLRASLVKAEHREWVARIYDVISHATDAVIRTPPTVAARAGGAQASHGRASDQDARASAHPD